MPEGTELSAPSHLPSNHLGCAHYMGGECADSTPAPLPRIFPLCWTRIKAEVGESCQTSLPITRRGGEGISTSDLKSRASSVCSLHVRASPARQQSPGSGMCQRFLSPVTGFEHPHLTRVQELEKQLRADIMKLVHTYQRSLYIHIKATKPNNELW